MPGFWSMFLWFALLITVPPPMPMNEEVVERKRKARVAVAVTAKTGNVISVHFARRSL